ncbi:hypothetical protein PRtIB026_A32450 [Pseudomonas sp. RtIB026]|nr:hypothetical protein PRtIB026_A32450 [Pseudomonas sp. RtIB026]
MDKALAIVIVMGAACGYRGVRRWSFTVILFSRGVCVGAGDGRLAKPTLSKNPGSGQCAGDKRRADSGQ